MFELTVRSEFSAAHFLRDYDGKCRNLHGHTYKVAVTVAGKDLARAGVVADFVELKKCLEKVLKPLDHSCLNDHAYFKEHNPSAENIAKHVFVEFRKLVKPVKVARVQVWESDRADVVYFE